MKEIKEEDKILETMQIKNNINIMTSNKNKDLLNEVLYFSINQESK